MVFGWLSDREFNNYLKKFNKLYKVSKCVDDPMKIIQGKYGRIEPYGRGKLEVWLKEELSQKRMGLLKRQLVPISLRYLNMTDGGSAIFLEEKIEGVASIIKVRKKRIMTEEQKEKLRNRLNKNLKRT